MEPMNILLCSLLILLAFLSRGKINRKIGAVESFCFSLLRRRKNVQKVSYWTDSEFLNRMSHAELDALLQELNKQTPVDSVTAMCYSTAGVHDRIEYVCPVCGDKTIYSSFYELVVLGPARSEFAKLKNLPNPKVELDERNFCKKCHSDLKEPELILRITCDDATVLEKKGITFFHLKLLSDFLAGHHDCDSQSLRKLLGIEEETE